MPIKPAAFKALRQNRRHAARNKKTKSDIQALVRRVRRAVAAKDRAAATKWLPQMIKKVDKAAQKKVLKKNLAARLKSRLSRAVRTLA